MASNLFDEDVVRRTHRGTFQFGLVLTNYEGYSSLEDSDDEEDMIKKGHIRVAWYPKGREEVVPENKVSLYDRSVMPGDAVRRMSTQDGDTQRGIVRSVNVSCHVQCIRTKQMIYDVPSKDLTQLLVFQPGGHCVLGSWIGVVRNVFVRVIVRLKNGSRCALSDEGASRLTDVHDNSEEDSVFSYQDGFYPGQVLRGPACAFKNASWLSGTQPILSSRAYFKVTVEEVNVVGLDVHWQTRGLCKGMSDMDGRINDEDMQPPARKVPEGTLPQVRPLNFFVAASIQIGDKAMFTVKSDSLRYPQPVPRGSPACFTKPPPTLQQTALQNAVNSRIIETNVDTGKPDIDKSICKDIANERNLKIENESLETPNTVARGDELTFVTSSQSGTDVDNTGVLGAKMSNSGTDVDLNIRREASGQSSSKMEDTLLEIQVTDGDNDAVHVSSSSSGTNVDYLDTVCSLSSTNVDVADDTGNSYGKDLSKDDSRAQDTDSGSQPVTNTDSSEAAVGKEMASADDNVESSKKTGDDDSKSTKNEVETDVLKLMGKGGFVEQCKEFEAVQSKTEVLHDRAAVLSSDLTRDVDLLSALHSDLCEASESIVKIADSFKPLLQRASSESAKEISGHVTRLLESRDRLNEQINLTEGLLKGGKKTIGVLQHLADIRKSKNQSKKEETAESSDEYFTDDEDDDDDDAGSQTGSIGSNASAKGTRSRPKVVSSRLLRHNRNQQPRLLTKKRPPPKPLEVGERTCTEVTHTWTLVDVMWQDGNFEKNIVSADLFPAHQLDELEFFPGDFVTKSNEDMENMYGLVCKADHKERTCLVQWIRRPTQHNPLPGKQDREEVSVYELNPHPDFTFNVGDVVVRIATSQAGTPQMPDDEQSCAGQVRWVNTDGTIYVAWVDDTESNVLPQDLYKLDEDSESDEWSVYGNDDEEWDELNGNKKAAHGSKSGSDSDGSWETASASLSTASSISAEGEQDTKSEGTMSTSISIEEAAKEDEDKMKKADKPAPMEQVEETQESPASDDADQYTKDTAEETKGATASAIICTTVDKDVGIKDTGVSSSLSLAKMDKSQLEKDLGSQTLAQLSDIEDKMNQLCTAANSLLNRKRFCAVGDEEKEGEKRKEEGCEEEEDGAKRVEEDVTMGEVVGQSETDTELVTDGKVQTSSLETAAVDSKADDAESTERASANNVCDNTSIPPMEDAISTDNAKSEQTTHELSSAIKTAARSDCVEGDVGAADEEHKTGNFILMEEVPSTHNFKSATFTPEDPKTFATSFKKEMKLLRTSLPQGIIVKGFSDRMDLFSVLFEGPDNTPYEDGLFFFDVRLPPDYPRSPPIMHFHAYCSGRLNPNLYNDGKVCVSLLGTWTGKGNEMWTSKSNLLQVLVSIQGLILVSEPYYNEAGYEKHRGSHQGLENSRMYNETAVLKLIQSMQMMVSTPPELFRDETLQFCRKHAYRMVRRVEQWLVISNQMASLTSSPPSTSLAPSSSQASSSSGSSSVVVEQNRHSDADVAFPLFPLSRGFLLSAKQALRAYRKSLHVAGIEES